MLIINYNNVIELLNSLTYLIENDATLEKYFAKTDVREIPELEYFFNATENFNSSYFLEAFIQDFEEDEYYSLTSKEKLPDQIENIIKKIKDTSKDMEKYCDVIEENVSFIGDEAYPKIDDELQQHLEVHNWDYDTFSDKYNLKYPPSRAQFLEYVSIKCFAPDMNFEDEGLIEGDVAEDIANFIGISDSILVGEYHQNKDTKEWRLESDASLLTRGGVGMELITPPLSLKELLEVLPKILQYIKNNGRTDHTTGLHFHLSVNGKKITDLDFVKIIALFDEGQIWNKFPERENNKYTSAVGFDKMFTANSTEAIKDFLSKKLDKNDLHKSISKTGYDSIRLTSETVEFRYLGGSGYEEKEKDIVNLIGQYAHLMLAGYDENFRKREYIDKLIRIKEELRQRTIRNYCGEAAIMFANLVAANLVEKYITKHNKSLIPAALEIISGFLYDTRTHGSNERLGNFSNLAGLDLYVLAHGTFNDINKVIKFFDLKETDYYKISETIEDRLQNLIYNFSLSDNKDLQNIFVQLPKNIKYNNMPKYFS